MEWIVSFTSTYHIVLPSTVYLFYDVFLAAVAPPPTKRPNKDPMPSYRPSPEQYAAMIEAATAAGQPLPRTHVKFN